MKKIQSVKTQFNDVYTLNTLSYVVTVIAVITINLFIAYLVK